MSANSCRDLHEGRGSSVDWRASHETIGAVPELTPPTIVAGSLAESTQPVIPVDGGVLLRPWVADDAPHLVAAYADPAIQHWHARRLDSLDEARQLISDWRGGWSKETGLHWAVVDSESDELVGRIALKPLDLQDGRAALAYWMMPAARGRGVCTRSVITLSEWAFHEVGFHRIDLEHSIANPASCRVATKAGFPAEGIRRGAARHVDDWHDMHVHARVRTDRLPQ
jgi:RimJ/RimL family protein N-acetyltransferase